MAFGRTSRNVRRVSFAPENPGRALMHAHALTSQQPDFGLPGIEELSLIVEPGPWARCAMRAWVVVRVSTVPRIDNLDFGASARVDVGFLIVQIPSCCSKDS